MKKRFYSILNEIIWNKNLTRVTYLVNTGHISRQFLSSYSIYDIWTLVRKTVALIYCKAFSLSTSFISIKIIYLLTYLHNSLIANCELSVSRFAKGIMCLSKNSLFCHYYRVCLVKWFYFLSTYYTIGTRIAKLFI